MTISPEHRHLRLAVQVFETLKRDIVSGTLTPDMQLSESELSQRLGVSRTPVREALIKLVDDGLVRIIPQVGTFVAPISLESVKEAQFVREHLECALIVDAGKKMDEKTIQRLRDNLEQQSRAARNDDWVLFMALDEELHGTLATAAGHPGAWRIIQQSKIHFDRVRHLSLRMPGQMRRLIQQHTTIVDAVARGDHDIAQAILRDHLREVFVTLNSLGLSGNPDGKLSHRRTHATRESLRMVAGKTGPTKKRS
ncbi:MAG: GntR family transcriptional regulator [Candidatus Korobacteraceae bacterium]